MREVKRGAFVNGWVAVPNEITDYSQCDKVSIVKGVRLNGEH